MDILKDEEVLQAAAEVTEHTLHPRQSKNGGDKMIPVLDEESLSDWDESDLEDANGNHLSLQQSASRPEPAAGGTVPPKELLPFSGDILDSTMLPASMALDAATESNIATKDKAHDGQPVHLYPPGRRMFLFDCENYLVLFNMVCHAIFVGRFDLDFQLIEQQRICPHAHHQCRTPYMDFPRGRG